MVTGSTPAQIGMSMSSSSSFGPPVRTFADASLIGIRITRVDCSSESVGDAGVRAASGNDVLDDGVQGELLLVDVCHLGRRPVDRDRPVVDRVVERRACEHETVDEGDRHADLDP